MPLHEPLSDLSSLGLDEIARLAEAQQLPPVESWDPAGCGTSGIRIARDGTWFHEGRPVPRPAMVRLFSTLLRREPDGRIVLVTPVEKLEVDVEDAPFVAVELRHDGEGRERKLAFRLNDGEVIIAGPDHRIRIEGTASSPRPALEVRHGLDARIARPVYYELAALALDEGPEPPGLWSGGSFFPLVTQ